MMGGSSIPRGLQLLSHEAVESAAATAAATPTQTSHSFENKKAALNKVMQSLRELLDS